MYGPPVWYHSLDLRKAIIGPGTQEQGKKAGMGKVFSYTVPSPTPQGIHCKDNVA